MKAVELLLNSKLPPELRKPRTLDKKGIDDLLAEVARTHPDQYASIVKDVSDIGRNASYLQGETLGVSDMKPTFDKEAVLAEMDREIRLAKREAPTPADFEDRKNEIWNRYSQILEQKTLSTALAARSNLGKSVVSGARGNPFQLKAMTTTPVLYTDYKDRVIPIFIRRSYGEGLRPADYLASTFGVRKSVISTKAFTAEGGYWAKQAIQASAPQVVTQEDCGTTNGMDYDVDDGGTLIGRVVAKDYPGIKAGSVIDKEVLSHLRKDGIKTVIARSPMTCQAKDGICSHCLGQLPTGHFAPKGYAAGITAAQAVSEPVTQGALSCLMSGTMVRMADFSEKPIEQIEPGDWVLGSDKDAHTAPVRVLRKFDQGMQPVIHYQFRYGASRHMIDLFATAKHTILANTKKSMCKDEAFNWSIRELPLGTKCHDFGAVLPRAYTGDNSYDEPMAFLVGLLLGNGCYTEAVDAVNISTADTALVAYLEDYLAPLNLKIVQMKGHDGIYYRFSQLKAVATPSSTVTGRFEKCGPINPIRRYLEDRGLFGKYAHEKCFPEDHVRWSQKSLSELIAGLFVTDGCVFTTKTGVHGVSFGSTSKKMITQLRDLLTQRFAIYPPPIQPGAKAGDGNGLHKHDMWTFNITRHDQIQRFRDLIPMQGIKKQRLDALQLEPRRDDFYRCPRKSQTPIGDRQCWDLEVDSEDALFVLANGLIVHNSKHTAGGFKGTKKQFTGFSVINQLTQSPDTFPDRAAVSRVAGKVHNITDAPQGGKYIHVGDEQHYALPGYDPIVKIGDQVEAGDQLSDGLMDVGDVMRTRGLGEARRYYVDRLKQALEESGAGKPTRLNLEVMARGALDHLRVDDPEGMGEYLPDDIASYNKLSSTYSPPASSKSVPLAKADGQYLQSPALHLTIGTKLTPKMLGRLDKAGIKDVHVSHEAPKFEPHMVRMVAASHDNPDWMARLYSSYQTASLEDAAGRARDTNTESNVHFAPRLAVGEGFGKNIATTGKF